MTTTVHGQRPHRWALLGAALIVFAIGIPNRLIPDRMPDFMVVYGGDALWAMFIYLMMAVLFPRIESARLAVFCLLMEWLVEASQLYQAPWINAVRHFRIGFLPLGGLILGYGFRWSDIAAYTVGTAAGYVLDRVLMRRSTRARIGEESAGAEP